MQVDELARGGVPRMFVKSVSTDAMIAAAAHVEREYGSGYSIGIVDSVMLNGFFQVRHFDGSEFELVSDRWGNVRRPECKLDGSPNV